ncbi:hypothetical protein JCM10207_007003 [Rhodosporidiobolus poonsookiae]
MRAWLSRLARHSPHALAAPTRSFQGAASLSRVPPEHERHPAFLDLEDALAPLPCFPTRGGDECVSVLYTPSDFYRTLLAQIAKAKRRIFIASLYVGKEEEELVAALHSALCANPTLRLTILCDYLRSTREHPHPSSASLLASLHAAFPTQVDLRLFHTPELSGLARRVVPKRFNEGWGLMHMKIYGVDDDVLLSGANLSHDYFTNRTDRYILFRSHPPLAAYFASLVALTARLSFRVTARDTSTRHPAIALSWPEDNVVPEDPFERARSRIASLKETAREEYERLTSEWARKSPQTLASPLPAFPPPPSSPSSSSSTSFPPPPPATRHPFLSHFPTSLRPLLQMGPFAQSQETDLVVPAVFAAADALATAPGGRATTLDWTSGYFALREEYKRLVLKCRANVRIVSASPEANGFHLSRGVSRFIPPAYTYFAQQFHGAVVAEARRRAGRAVRATMRVDEAEQESHVEMREWKREGWTYHAKGIWLSPSVRNPFSPPAPSPSDSFSRSHASLDPSTAPHADLPSRYLHPPPSPPFLTLLGSSNFGARSAQRDLEAGILLTTQDRTTRWALEREVRGIREFATEKVGHRLFEQEERYVPLGVRVAARAIEGML